MRISLNWLQSLIDINLPVQKLVDDLSMLGLETERVDTLSRSLEGVVAGKVVTCEEVPESDHLHLCQVDAGDEEQLQVVCGAPNIRAGQTVPLARVGAVLAGGLKIRKAKVRGVESFGMICSEVELDLGDDHSGILVLDDDIKPGQELGELWGYEDTILDLEVTQNRGDCLSILGIARELAALYECDLSVPQKTVPEVSDPASKAVSIELSQSTSCGRYAARVMRGITIKPSPRWMQDRLLAVGLRPISNVVDVTNYVMWLTGHPLHAFDMRDINGRRIKVRFAERDETFVTLDEEKRKLDPEVLLICDEQKPVAIGGIMGGLDSGVVADTAELLIECAWFEPVNIRMSSRRLDLSSDSSRRFERGVDPDDIEYVLNLTAALMLETAGGEVLKGIVDEYPNRRTGSLIKVRSQRVNKVLGMEIPLDTQISLLRRLQFGVKESGDEYQVTVPTFRFDLEREIDIIEEIIRLHGYESIPVSEQSLIPLKPWIEKMRPLRADLRETAVRAGLQEVSTYSMISKKQHEQTTSGSDKPIRVQNPISEDLAVLRTSMLPSLLMTAAYNLNRSNRSVAIFEIGRTYHFNDKVYNKCREDYVLGVMLCGVRQPKSWDREEQEFVFYDIQGIANLFASRFGVDLKRLPEVDSRFTGNSHLLTMANQVVSAYGELNPELVEGFEINQSVYYLELNLSSLQKHYRSEISVSEVSRFPDNRRDLSFQIEESVMIGEIMETIHKHGGKHLRSLEFFDLYRGKGVDQDCKSASFNLCFNSLKGSLEDEQIDRQIKKIIRSVENEHNGRLR
jgi:phenylalanyl-tRNA synthetase beta chain